MKLQLIKHTFIHALVDTSKKAHLVGINYEIRFIIYRVISGSQECLLFISVTSECKVPRVLHALDYYPLWLFHVSTNDTKVKLETIRQDFRALGMMIKDLGVQTFFFSILPGRMENGRRRRQIFQANNWLHHWCWQEAFGSYDHGTLFKDRQLMGRQGIYLSKWHTCLCQQVGQPCKEGFKP